MSEDFNEIIKFVSQHMKNAVEDPYLFKEEHEAIPCNFCGKPPYQNLTNKIGESFWAFRKAGKGTIYGVPLRGSVSKFTKLRNGKWIVGYAKINQICYDSFQEMMFSEFKLKVKNR